MKTIFLIPPSEWKSSIWSQKESLSFDFEKPLKIAENATQKDLKCKEKRFEEAIFLNKNISKNSSLEAIKRYNWVMFKHIDFENMDEKSKNFFLENFLIISWMYWLLSPNDKIWNYKLPISTKWLYDFWGNKIFDEIIKLSPDFIVNFLPKDYEKVLNLKENKNILLEKNIKIVNVNFLKNDLKKVSHGVKIIKAKFIKNICQEQIIDYKNFWWKISFLDDIFINVDIFEKKW